MRRAAQAPAQTSDDCGQERKYNDGGNHIMDTLTNIGYERGQEVASQNRAAGPDEPTDHVVGEITRIAHPRCAGHGWTEGAHDRHESGEDDRFAAVGLVEMVRTFEVPPLEEERVFAPVECLASLAPDPVAHLVAANRAERNQRQQ